MTMHFTHSALMIKFWWLLPLGKAPTSLIPMLFLSFLKSHSTSSMFTIPFVPPDRFPRALLCTWDVRYYSLKSKHYNQSTIPEGSEKSNNSSNSHATIRNLIKTVLSSYKNLPRLCGSPQWGQLEPRLSWQASKRQSLLRENPANKCEPSFEIWQNHGNATNKFNSIAIFFISVTKASSTAFHDGKTSLARVSKFARNCQQMLWEK